MVSTSHKSENVGRRMGGLNDSDGHNDLHEMRFFS
jgi:hypothetical protein